MWAHFIDDRTLLCLAVNVTKHGISSFGRNNLKFSKTVAYVTYTVFQCSLSQGHVTLNRGSSGRSVGTGLVHEACSGGRGMAWLTFFRPCTRVKMRVTLDASVQWWRIFRLRTQPRAFASACNNLPFLISFSDRVINLDLHRYHNNVWMPRYGFLQNRHLFWPAVLRDLYFWCKA